MDSIKNLFIFLTAYRKVIRVEHRVFNVMCLIAVLSVLISIPFTCFIGLNTTSWILGAMFLALCMIYYLARFREMYSLAMLLASTSVPAMLSLNFFYSAGILGTTLPSLVLTLFLILIVVSRKLAFVITTVCLLSGIIIIFVEYYHPQLVGHTYIDRRGIYFSAAYAHIFSVMVIFFGIYYLKKIYFQEKVASENRAAQLALLNEEKNKLFSIVAHDLRAPLASIQGYMQLLKVAEMESGEREMMEDKLTEALSGTQQMLDNLLSWSRSQLSSITPDLRQHELSKLLLPLLQMQHSMAAEKGIYFTTELPDDVSAYCDADMLQLVIRNLTGNAIKFTAPGGKVKFNALLTEEECLLSVSDSGIGIPEEKSASIFSLKTSSTFGTQNEKGIGLGLYLCKEYTLIQQGRIWFEANDTRGTVFYVALKRSAPIASI